MGGGNLKTELTEANIRVVSDGLDRGGAVVGDIDLPMLWVQRNAEHLDLDTVFPLFTDVGVPDLEVACVVDLVEDGGRHSLTTKALVYINLIILVLEADFCREVAVTSREVLKLDDDGRLLEVDSLLNNGGLAYEIKTWRHCVREACKRGRFR